MAAGYFELRVVAKRLCRGNPFFKKLTKLFGLIFEIQVRTINQDCWAYIAHSVFYKQEISLPEKFKRRIFRLVSLYELADDEFDQMNSIIISNPDFPIYQILNQMEGKFYRFAKNRKNCPCQKTFGIIYGNLGY